MALRYEIRSVLIISGTDQLQALFCETGLKDSYAPVVTAHTVGEARRLLVKRCFDIAVVNTPLKDGFGIEAAKDLSADPDMGVLLLVKDAIYEQVAADVEHYGVVTLAKPSSRQAFAAALRMLGAMLSKVRAVERETIDLKSRMEEIKIVNRAKWLLIAERNMDEPQAHRYIEKQAMDRCVPKKTVAEEIIQAHS